MSVTRVQLGEGGGTITSQPDSTVTSIGADGKMTTRENTTTGVTPEQVRETADATKKEAEEKAAKEAEGKAPAKEGEETPAPEGDKPKEGDEGEKPGDPLEAFTNEYAEKGTLSDESVTKAAEQFGVSEDVVRTYLKGLETSKGEADQGVEKVVNSITGEFGGAEEYGKFQEWANANLTAQQHAFYNRLLDTDPDGALEYARELKSKYAAAGNQQRRDITKGQASSKAEEAPGFRSTDEMKKAMNDPRYKSDPAYRKEVEAKVARM